MEFEEQDQKQSTTEPHYSSSHHMYDWLFN